MLTLDDSFVDTYLHRVEKGNCQRSEACKAGTVALWAAKVCHLETKTLIFMAGLMQLHAYLYAYQLVISYQQFIIED